MHRFQRWRQVLENAHTQADVERAIRDYAATLAPVLSALPAECKRAIEHENVQEAAVSLLHSELGYRGGSAETAQILHEIAHTYAAASLRLSRIKSEPLAPTTS